MLKKLRPYIPRFISNLWHLFFAWYGAAKYGHPSEELMVIGITGTSGKSSTVYFLKQLLESAGFTVGALSTVEFCVAGKCELNDKKMTMLGKTHIQKYLRAMVDAGCDIAIIETTSEGFVQHRHRYINYDTIILTNLYPEHIESHGSFENYKQAKLGIFSYVSGCRVKRVEDLKNLQQHQIQKNGRIPKTCIVNAESQYAIEFLKFPFNQRAVFGRAEDIQTSLAQQYEHLEEFYAQKICVKHDGLHFEIDGKSYHAPVHGTYNVHNVAAAISVTKLMNMDAARISAAVQSLRPVPGRIEFIPEVERLGFRAIVDYSFEPVAMKALYEVVTMLKPHRIIHVLGSTGGGRDVSRRFSVGELVGKFADICIITNEDPYDDDPCAIMNDVASAVEKSGKEEGKNLFIIKDRGEAIMQAITAAQKGDVVLVTGKGSEQKMCVAGGKMIDWDDREKVREALKYSINTEKLSTISGQ